MPKIGAGYRVPLHDEIVNNLNLFDVLEVTIDTYFSVDQHSKTKMEELIGVIPLVAHGLGLSLGTDTLPEPRYLEKVYRLIEQFKFSYYSEHIAFTRVPGLEMTELLPLPKNQQTIDRLITNIKFIQSFIDVPIHLENIAYYFDYPNAQFTDGEFLNILTQETDITLLLDVQNLYVNSVNNGVNPTEIINNLKPGSVRALHVAGGSWAGDVLLDNHGHSVPQEVHNLVSLTLERHNPDYIILERDERFDHLHEIYDDLNNLRSSASVDA